MFTIENQQNQQNRESDFLLSTPDDYIRSIRDCIAQLTSKVCVLANSANKNLMDQKIILDKIVDRLENLEDRRDGDMQLRYKNIQLVFPHLEGLEQKIFQKQVLNWVGKVCKKVFSVGFQYFKRGQIQINKIKAFCCQNIIRNILKLAKKTHLKASLLQKIDSCMKNELLPYFCLKYPQTEQKQANKKFSNLLIERDTIADNQNDLFHKSGIKFKLQQNGNYNSQIMEFFNFVINLPNKPTPGQQAEKSTERPTLAQSFYSDMQSIFKMVESEKNKIKMLKIDPKKPSKSFSISQMNESANQPAKQKQKLEYLEKVKSYTSYLIGQKLSQNFRQFNQFQIQSGNLRLSNSSIMRVVTKWCEELQKYFEEEQIMNREHPFKMGDGSQKYLSKLQMQALNIMLQREKQIITLQLNQIRKNNYEHQSSLSHQKTQQSLCKLSEDEAMVGQFTSAMFKINQNYLINYLNMLIHGILSATQKFNKYKSYYQNDMDEEESPQEEQMLKSFINKLQGDSLNKLDKEYQNNLELITFKVGDLLRCKCTSRQNEIIALYRYIERISYQNPSHLKLLRVKNRLNQANKDILMNILYKQTVIIEMQLAILSQKSKFIDCSNKFNHYLYQLRRAQFGPIMEMCSIWTSQDFRSQFYLQKNKVLNRRKSPHSKGLHKQCCFGQKNTKLIRLPFKCCRCKSFYYDCSFTQKHIFCKVCNENTCFMCQFQSASDKKKQKLLPQVIFNPSVKPQSIRFLQQIPEIGAALINLKAKNKKPLLFNTINYENQFYIFQQGIEISEDGEKKVQLKFIEKLKDRKLPQKFRKDILIFSSPQIDDLLPPLDLQRAEINYFIPTYLQKIQKKHKRSVFLIKKNLNQQILGKFNIKDQASSWPLVKKLNFSENNFTSIEILPQRFPNAQLIVLSDNKIESFASTHFMNWKNMRELYLSKNNIEDTEPIFINFHQIQKLDISKNQIKKLSNEIKNLKKMKLLKIQSNPIQQLPEQIGQLISLKELNLSQTELKSLPSSIQKLANLIELDITKSKIESLPDQFGNLPAITLLRFKQNCLKKIPQTFCQLNLLNALVIEKQQLQQLPDKFGELKSLKIILLNELPIKTLPESFSNLAALQSLSILNSRLQKIPQQIGYLLNLSSLCLSQLPISELPDSISNMRLLKNIFFVKLSNLAKLPEQIGNLKSLKSLGVLECGLVQLPASFGNLSSLSQLMLVNNQITRLPDNIQLQSLTEVFLSENNLQELPESFGKLTCLQRLHLWRTKIQKLPESFINLKSLSHLVLLSNNIKILPQKFNHLVSLNKLGINQPNLQKIPEQLAKLTYMSIFNLVLYNVPVDSIPKQVIKKLTKLQLKYSTQRSQEQLAPLKQICQQNKIPFKYTHTQL